MKPDYKNWVPKGMVYGLAGGTIPAAILGMRIAEKVLKKQAGSLK